MSMSERDGTWHPWSEQERAWSLGAQTDPLLTKLPSYTAGNKFNVLMKGWATLPTCVSMEPGVQQTAVN